MITTKWVITFIFIISSIMIIIPNSPVNIDQQSSITTAVGDPEKLKSQYEKWKAYKLTDKANNELSIRLVSSKQHTPDSSGGLIAIDAHDNSLSSIIYNTSKAPLYPSLNLWAVGDGEAPLRKSAISNAILLGSYRHLYKENYQGAYLLEASIEPLMEDQFKIAQFVVTTSTETHLETIVLAGSPSLFQRLWVQEQLSTRFDNPRDFRLSELLVPVANAAEATGFPDVFNDLVTQGEDLFFNETFDGNGRNCGTCHPATNNFTIDTDFIASLPNDDPLFVAEFVPALMFGASENLDQAGNPRRFENPALMRAFGLIVENVDGMGDLTNRFVMRSVQHNIGMTVSVERPVNGLTPPEDRTGWGGDGAPVGIVGGLAASGRVRDFLLGAIVQHYPKTLARSFSGPTPDFRAPTVQELDAMEAFLFSVGRQNELELTTGAPNALRLKDASAAAGQILFTNGIPEGTTNCNVCHRNAGANASDPTNPGNRNFNVGTETFLRNRINDPSFTVVGEPRPVDGGFGTNPSGTFSSLTPQPGFVNENFGDQTFNTVSLVEAADTAPFFHNNVADTLEDAIAVYNSPEFLAASGNFSPFSSTQVRQIANFLRVINAIDNIENSALRQVNRALLALNQQPTPNEVITRIGEIIIADTEDAIKVLNEGGMHNSGGLPMNAVRQMERASQRVSQAMNPRPAAVARANHLNQAREHLENALALMRF